jgi:hypothetical protein
VKPFFLLDELTHHLQRSSTDPVPPQGTPPPDPVITDLLLSDLVITNEAAPASKELVDAPSAPATEKKKAPLHLLSRRKKLPHYRRPKPPSFAHEARLWCKKKHELLAAVPCCCTYHVSLKRVILAFKKSIAFNFDQIYLIKY